MGSGQFNMYFFCMHVFNIVITIQQNRTDIDVEANVETECRLAINNC